MQKCNLMGRSCHDWSGGTFKGPVARVPGRVRLKVPMPADPLGKLTESRRVVLLDLSSTRPYIANCGAGVAHRMATFGQAIWKRYGLSSEYKLGAQAQKGVMRHDASKRHLCQFPFPSGSSLSSHSDVRPGRFCQIYKVMKRTTYIH